MQRAERKKRGVEVALCFHNKRETKKRGERQAGATEGMLCGCIGTEFIWRFSNLTEKERYNYTLPNQKVACQMCPYMHVCATNNPNSTSTKKKRAPPLVRTPH